MGRSFSLFSLLNFRHTQYVYHFPLPPPPASAEDGSSSSSANQTGGVSSSHDMNQRHVMLYGAGGNLDGEDAKAVKRVSREMLKLFHRKASIDVSEGGKVG